jgi:hypothetical protein
MQTILAANRALAEDVGLIVTFGGLGVLVGVILAYIAFQIRGERQQNREYRLSGRDTGAT